MRVPTPTNEKTLLRWAQDATNKLNTFFGEFTSQSELRLPIASMMKFAGIMTPDGWIPCDGRELATKSYPQLAKALGADLSLDRFNVPTETGFMIKV